MSEAGRGFAEKFIGPAKIRKSENIITHDEAERHFQSIGSGQTYSKGYGKPGHTHSGLPHGTYTRMQVPLNAINQDTHENPMGNIDPVGDARNEEAAHGYAKLQSLAPAILLQPHPAKLGQFKTLDGVHRARAAHLRGETHIDAYVLNKSEDLEKGPKDAYYVRHPAGKHKFRVVPSGYGPHKNFLVTVQSSSGEHRFSDYHDNGAKKQAYINEWSKKSPEEIDAHAKSLKKDEQPIPQPPVPLVLQIPVSLHGKSTKMTVKNFGDMNTIDHQTIQSTIDGQKFHEPIDASKMIFKPHALKGVDGRETHVLLVYGAPHKIMNMKGSTPYIPIDKDDYEKFRKLGPALTSEATGIKFHPAELKAGDQVLKTY